MMLVIIMNIGSEYNVGRIILGDCVDENITDVISYRDMLNHYPYVIDIIVK